MTDQPTTHRPRRSLSPPRIAEADRLPEEELQRARQQAARRWMRIVRSR